MHSQNFHESITPTRLSWYGTYSLASTGTNTTSPQHAGARRTKASVLDTLEDAFGCRTQTAMSIRKNLLLHVVAMQNALGGNPSDLAQMGQFMKCPVQIEQTK